MPTPSEGEKVEGVFLNNPDVENSIEITRFNKNKDDEATFVNARWQRFKKAEVAVAPKHQVWSQIDKFDRGEQWEKQGIPPWIPKPVTNMLRYVRTLKRANLASQIPSANFSAYFREEEGQVKQIQQAYEHVWQTEHCDRLVRKCIDRSLTQGTALAYVYVEDSIQGRYFSENDPNNCLYQNLIRIKRIPILNFFPDPDAYFLDDCKYIEITEAVSLNQIKNNPAFIKYAGDKLQTIKTQQLMFDDEENGADLERDGGPLNNQFGQIVGDEMVTLHTHWEKYTDAKGNWHVDVSYYIPYNNFLLLHIQDVKPNAYPFAMLYDEEEENDIFGKSIQMDIFQNQIVVNKADQVASIIGVLNQNPQKIVARESGINAQDLAKTGTMPGKVWASNTDPTRSIHVLQPPDIPKGLFELKDRTMADIKDTAGINEAYQGNAVGSLTTSTGVNDLIQRATIRDKDKMINIDTFVERLSNLIVLFMLYHWKDVRPTPVLQKDGTTQFGQWNPFKSEKDIKNLQWYVKSDVYAHSAINQQKMQQDAQQMLQAQGQYHFQPELITPEEFVQMMGFANGDKIIARMEAQRQAMDAQQQDGMAQLAQMLASAGGLTVNMGTKDPRVILQTLQIEQQNAQQKAQQAMQQANIGASMDTGQQMQNGPVNQATPPSNAPLAPANNAPNGTPNPAALANMNRGR